jgi:hypothetical protein
VVPLALLERFRKYFPFDPQNPSTCRRRRFRAVKSAYELACMEEAGRIHRTVLEERVTGILKERDDRDGSLSPPSTRS